MCALALDVYTFLKQTHNQRQPCNHLRCAHTIHLPSCSPAFSPCIQHTQSTHTLTLTPLHVRTLHTAYRPSPVTQHPLAQPHTPSTTHKHSTHSITKSRINHPLNNAQPHHPLHHQSPTNNTQPHHPLNEEVSLGFTPPFPCKPKPGPPIHLWGLFNAHHVQNCGGCVCVWTVV